jgi:hypothetical protein
MECLPEDKKQHVDVGVCGKCRKKFLEGDRIVHAYIFSHAGVDPRNLAAKGAFLHEEYELVHADCTDPKLKKGFKL